MHAIQMEDIFSREKKTMKHLSVVKSLSWLALLLCESKLNHLDLESIVVF